ncbi:M23 family metallopeptidase [Mucilaginibacter sp. HC2]|nr:M23 family metallopeptidase [Mucilaginibacter inviolabilis]
MAVRLWGILLMCSLPLRQIRLTSGFGYRLHPIYHRIKLHAGIDLAAHRDTVFSVLDGVVQSCRYNPTLGLFITIDHGSSLNSIYGHLSQWLVTPGDSVNAGEAIGITGSTGVVTGEHLHFAVNYGSRWLNPLKFLYYTIYRNPGP